MDNEDSDEEFVIYRPGEGQKRSDRMEDYSPEQARRPMDDTVYSLQESAVPRSSLQSENNTESQVHVPQAPTHGLTMHNPKQLDSSIIDAQGRPKSGTDIDRELESLLSKHRASIKVIGTGGAGNNTANRITEVGIAGAEIIAVNTDAQDLIYTTADKKILLGKELTHGLGAGANPKVGEEAAKESEHEIRNALQGADMVFITCGLGGGTGTGSAPIIADIAKKLNALVVGVVTLPFSMEGFRRYENAIAGLERLEAVVDTLIVIPNDKLLELAPDLPIHTAFKVADEILMNAVRGIAELVTKAGLINLDFADIRAVMSDGGVALIGVGESNTSQRALEAVDKAILNPLLDVDISGASGALINVAGGPDLTLTEARSIVEKVSERLDANAKVIWGAQIYDDMAKTVRVMLIVTGVQSSQILGRTGIQKKEAKHIEHELGIEFV